MARFQRGDETREVASDETEAQLALLADGFVRVPDREIDDTGEPRDAELERAIHDHPDDDQPWLVYADLLIERGHPRGPLVALESAPVKNIVQRAEREAETRRMRLAASDVLLGSLRGRGGLSLQWKRGFIHRAKLHGAFERGGAEDLLVDLLAHPSARFLRELELACSHHDVQDHRLLTALLVHSPAPPPLRKLLIDYDTMDWVGFPPLGDIGALGTAYPQLDNVRLASDDTSRLAGLALPRATHFELATSALPAHTARALAAAPWPALESLELGLHACTLPFADFAWVLALPNLRALHLRAATFANAVIDALVRHPIAGQIATLDLSEGALDDRGVEQLVQARDRFPKNLRFVATKLSAEAREMLEDADIDFDRWRW